jgi:hypothetical protein
MTAVVGGLRARFLHDSLSALVESGLRGLGWFDEGRSHQPFKILHGPHTWSVPVAFNALVITTEAVDTDWVELGSNLTTDMADLSIDFYAESDSLGVHVSNDIRDLLRGRLPGGAEREQLPILDFRQPTPAPIGHAYVLDTAVDRLSDQVPEEWSRHVFSISVTLLDTYY